ncbi:hypothetical protein Agabi119p4_10296 [Agaricus bisporus var. burnettii]|uniref:Uncharacterized protein n=1 Tax=Agaricus bisporus var. burnettii TaxID=192524 RepID=A0A8H7EWH1_AGABI|nr:hypothetical protein Agabi119p4_10296 [Agaricus bisporus var. burnettii]
MNHLSATLGRTRNALLSFSPSLPLSDVLERNLKFGGFHDCACRICHECMMYAALEAELASYVKGIREREVELRDLYPDGFRQGLSSQCKYNIERLKQEIKQLHDNFMALQLAHADIEICAPQTPDSPHLPRRTGSLDERDDADFDDDKDDSAYAEWKEHHSSDMDLGSSDLSGVADGSDDDMVFSSSEVDEPMNDSYSDDEVDCDSHVSLVEIYVGPFVEDEQQEAPISQCFFPQYVNERSSKSPSQRPLWYYHEESALEDIREKMERARIPGENQMLARIKRLVTNAHNTPASSRTKIQKVLLSEWRYEKNPPRPRIFGIRTREVYVDASRSGIGFYFEDQWQAWVLNPVWWDLKRCDIQWAEAVAVELGLRLLVEAGLSNCKIQFRSDNQRVVDAIHSDEIYESHFGEVIYCINYLCRTHKIKFSIEWISGNQNPADGPSRLLIQDESRRFPYDIGIPDRLRNLVFPYRSQTY